MNASQSDRDLLIALLDAVLTIGSRLWPDELMVVTVPGEHSVPVFSAGGGLTRFTPRAEIFDPPVALA